MRIRILKNFSARKIAMPVTAKDIARELNLSQPTVSRILNGDQRHRVAEETRRRVLEAAQRLEYRPNAVARSLRRGQTDIIGLYTHHNYDARNDFLGTIIGSLQRSCEARGLDLLLHSALHGRPPDDTYTKLRDGRIDGLILHVPNDDALVEILGRSSLPVVAIADPLPLLPSVVCDDAQGMRLLIAHLWEQGYRRFVFLSPQDAPMSVVRRRDAFQAEMRSRGISADNALIIPIHSENPENPEEELSLLRQIGGHPAVCCWNDRTAYHLLRLCRAFGIRVPEDLAVAGFDGFRDEKAPALQLVTMACPWEQVAATAMDVLVRMITQRAAGCEASSPLETCLPVTLLTGDTI
jgi:LacI family transcriptional regulator